MGKKNGLTSLLVVFIALLIMWPRFGAVISHPNGYLFTKHGDGLKNYFVFSYYLRHNQGLTFSGLNHPYGDNLLFTDSSPFLALVLNFIDDHLVSISSHPIALLNLTLIAGLLLAVFFLYLILRHLHLPAWYAGLIALVIFFLSPQIDRINGHLSLANALVLPLSIWLLLRAETSNRSGWWFFCLGTMGFLAGGIHLYFTAIISAFLMAYFVIKWLSRPRSGETFWLTNRLLLASALLPLAAFLILSAVSDPFSDRPTSPYGFYVYHANFASIFLPYHSAVTEFLSKIFKLRMNWEGRAFVGTVPVFFVVLWASRGFYHRWQSWRKGTAVFGSQELASTLDSTEDEVATTMLLRQFLLAAILVLLFSMCIPFEWGLQFLVEAIPPLKQFRALGRFSWVFYYIVGVAASVHLYQSYRWIHQRRPILAVSALVLLLLIWASEAGSHYLNRTKADWPINDSFESNDSSYLNRFKMAEINPDKFQGIMALPLVSIRTDKMVFNRNFEAYNEALSCAFHTGLPIVQSSTSRPSLSQSFSNIQLISDPRIRKTRLDDMSEKPLLLITAKNAQLTANERRLVKESTWFWGDADHEFHSMPLSVFIRQQDSMHELSLREIVIQGVTCLSQPDHIFHYDGFEDHTSDLTFMGQGAAFKKRGALEVFSGELRVDSAQLEACFWLYIDPTYDGMPVLEYRYGPNQKSLTSQRIDVRSMPDVMDGWLRVSLNLESVIWHELRMLGREIRVDELLIIQKGKKVMIKHADGKSSINNFPISD